eukprot:5266402-Pyramimonas_sp.AAC.1
MAVNTCKAVELEDHESKAQIVCMMLKNENESFETQVRELLRPQAYGSKREKKCKRKNDPPPRVFIDTFGAPTASAVSSEVASADPPRQLFTRLPFVNRMVTHHGPAWGTVTWIIPEASTLGYDETAAYRKANLYEHEPTFREAMHALETFSGQAGISRAAARLTAFEMELTGLLRRRQMVKDAGGTVLLEWKRLVSIKVRLVSIVERGAGSGFAAHHHRDGHRGAEALPEAHGRGDPDCARHPAAHPGRAHQALHGQPRVRPREAGKCIGARAYIPYIPLYTFVENLEFALLVCVRAALSVLGVLSLWAQGGNQLSYMWVVARAKLVGGAKQGSLVHGE